MQNSIIDSIIKSVHTFFKEKVPFPCIDSSFQRLLNIAYMIGSQNFEVD